MKRVPAGRREATGDRLRALASATAAIELQRALLVARLMDLGPEWAEGAARGPGWWLSRWARRLAAELLTVERAAELARWMDRAESTLTAGREIELESLDHPWQETPRQARLALRRSWLVTAAEVLAQGEVLEEHIVAAQAREARTASAGLVRPARPACG